jgi:hypothetical protein
MKGGRRGRRGDSRRGEERRGEERRGDSRRGEERRGEERRGEERRGEERRRGRTARDCFSPSSRPLLACPQLLVRWLGRRRLHPPQKV